MGFSKYRIEGIFVKLTKRTAIVVVVVVVVVIMLVYIAAPLPALHFLQLFRVFSTVSKAEKESHLNLRPGINKEIPDKHVLQDVGTLKQAATSYPCLQYTSISQKHLKLHRQSLK